MKLLHTLFISFVLFRLASTAPPPNATRAACSVPSQRKPWHKLSNAEKLDYINAELCLMKLPAKLGLPGAKTRFDDFQAIHQKQAYMVHFVGAFLPFHRLHLYAHEQAMRNECGYKGFQPYWHEPFDAGNFKNASIFGAVYGFGGDGVGPDCCIPDGPFKNYTNSLGPAYQITNHCINRKFNEDMSTVSSQENVDVCMMQVTWPRASMCIEGSPHGGGHAGIGGQMVDPVASPGDPIFYLHHTWLDKLWWDWQTLNKTANLMAMGNSNIMPENVFGFDPRPPGVPVPIGAPGDPGTETTLEHILNMYGELPNKTIADVMDIQSGFLCYDYISP